MRTLVSLRLVCPKAFNTGILKQHSMSGALLFGPPGTGKTHMMKAIAKESGARMVTIIQGMYWVGETEKSIDALFKLARLLKPCIIFIDEFDALFGARVAAKEGYSRWRTDMLTQFAQEMDGMQSSDVIVVGATNRPFDLDDAIIRRLPCRILVDLPDHDAREAILGILLKDEQLGPDVALVDLASLTPNFSGSDLK
ncbi:P-loop containing nucleoside triphosphate hydrolase protein, partial [Rhizoctonia solani]